MLRNRWRAGGTLLAACTLALSLLAPVPAAAADPFTFAQIKSSAGTFLQGDEPAITGEGIAGGHESNPEVTITGATPGEVVQMIASGQGYPDIVVASCDVTASVVVMNGTPSGCATPATFSVIPNDGHVFLIARNAANHRSVFTYFKDNVAPYAPVDLTATQRAAGGVHLTWSWSDPYDPDPNAPMRIERVWRSAPDAADPSSTSWTNVATVNATYWASTACTTHDTPVVCTFDDLVAGGHRYFYRVSTVDYAANEGSPSATAPASGPGVMSAPAAPVLVSVGGETTSPAYGLASHPVVKVQLGSETGTVIVTSDGTQVASKAAPVANSIVTVGSADYSGGIPPRAHALHAQLVVNGAMSAPSNTFEYVRPPRPPVVSTVEGHASPAAAATGQPAVQISGVLAQDTVRLYDDDDCAGPHGATLVATSAPASGTTVTISSYAIALTPATHCLSATTTDPTIADAPTATSAPSAPFVYDQKPNVDAYVLADRGRVTNAETGVAAIGSPVFGASVARRLVITPDKTGGYVLDGYGGLHPVSLAGAPAPAVPTGAPYFGWDIARAVVLVSQSSGYVLDGFGGVHAFGGAPKASGSPYFGWDIARDLVVTPGGSGGYVLDGRGGIHGFSIGGGPRPTPGPGSPTFTWDIARRMVLRSATSGYLLDGFGGVHAFGGAPAAAAASYHAGRDSARFLGLTEVDGDGGYVLDSSRPLTTWGDALPIVEAGLLPEPLVDAGLVLS